MRPEDLPVPQRNRLWVEDFENLSENCTFWARKVWEKSGIALQSIRTMVQLGPGVGTDTAGFAALFPEAEFYLVDYHNSLHPSLKQNPHIHFHQGLFTEVLQQGVIPPADLTILRFISRHHGFTKETGHLLQELVGSGYLLTDGDNGGIEDQPFFMLGFSRVRCLDGDIFGTFLWKRSTPVV